MRKNCLKFWHTYTHIGVIPITLTIFLTAAIRFSTWLDQQFKHVNNFIKKTHKSFGNYFSWFLFLSFSSMFPGFLLVVSRVFFSSCFKEILLQVAYIKCVRFFYGIFFTLIYFFTFYIILFVLPFSFWTTSYKFPNQQLFIQILIIPIYLVKSKSIVNLYDIFCVQCNYLWTITSKNVLKRTLNVTFNFFLHIIFVTSCHRACVYLSQFLNSKLQLLTVIYETRKYLFILIITTFFKILIHWLDRWKISWDTNNRVHQNIETRNKKCYVEVILKSVNKSMKFGGNTRRLIENQSVNFSIICSQ